MNNYFSNKIISVKEKGDALLRTIFLFESASSRPERPGLKSQTAVRNIRTPDALYGITVTGVPTATRSNRSITSSFSMRMQP